jgi:hypothetical protein
MEFLLKLSMAKVRRMEKSLVLLPKLGQQLLVQLADRQSDQSTDQGRKYQPQVQPHTS